MHNFFILKKDQVEDGDFNTAIKLLKKDEPREYSKCISHIRNIMSDFDMWFVIHNDYFDTIAECLIVIEDNVIVISNVFVNKKFRNNGYCKLLLLNVLFYLEQNYKDMTVVIEAFLDNEAAMNSYEKIFGPPVETGLDMALFEFKL
jgi:ribosomal protein S18 acetylase RimI-like enzyme